MKAATSWVYAHLSETPGVAVSPLKEVQFFNSRFSANAIFNVDLLALKRLAYHISRSGDPVANLRNRPAFQASVDRARMIFDDNAYFEHFASLASHDTRVFADLTPAYAGIGEAGFEFMRRICASQDMTVKILFILRDPVDRLWSHLRFLPQLDPNFDPLQDWESRLGDPATMVRSDYRGTIEAMERVFPKEDVLTLFYEELFDRGFGQLCSLLGLVPRTIDKDRRFNETERKLPLPDHVGEALRAKLENQYAFCRERFGPAVPALWRH